MSHRLAEEPGAAVLMRNRLRALLGRLRWSKTGGLADRYELWAPTTSRRDEDREVLVPLNEQGADFARLLNRAVHALRSTEDEAERDLVVAYLREDTFAFDRAEWKAEETVREGAIWWKVGLKLYQTAQRQLTAAAKSTKAPGKMAYGKLERGVADEFLRTTLMGQTRVGSYIVSALTPRDNVLVKGREESGEDEVLLLKEANANLTNGLVLSNLGTAVDTLKSAVREYRSTQRSEVFQTAVRHGVSHDLVSAIRESIESNAVAITIVQGRSWDRPSAEVVFEPDEAAYLRTAERVLSPTYRDPTQSFGGLVELLQRREGNRIRLTTELNGKMRVVQAELTPEQYEVAIRAHWQKAPLHISGTLTGLQTKMPTIQDITAVILNESVPLFDRDQADQ